MLNVGEKAPDFDLMSDEGKQVRLRDFKGKTVVLYFYPKDDTPGCTREACSFRDDLAQFKKKNSAILGVSLDDVKSHEAFKKKYGLTFPLLSDQGAIVSKAYGVYKKKNMYGHIYWGLERTTFVIGPDGKIRSVFSRVKVDGHSQELLEVLA
jgi:peroxiredoxin Q/BCP